MGTLQPYMTINGYNMALFGYIMAVKGYSIAIMSHIYCNIQRYLVIILPCLATYDIIAIYGHIPKAAVRQQGDSSLPSMVLLIVVGSRKFRLGTCQ